MRDIDIIINILKEGGGELRLKDIENLFCEIKNVSYDNYVIRASARETIERYCLDYKNGGERGDVFYKRKDGRKTYIGLKSKLYPLDDIEIKEIEKDLDEIQYKEGQINERVTVSNKPVRNAKLRKDYLNHLQKVNKLKCEICGEYENDREMLDVHHLFEISNYKEINKTHSTFNDVIALCPCCHRKVHLGRIEDIKK